MPGKCAELYSTLEDAGHLIHERWRDTDLRTAVEHELVGDIPEIVHDGPSGMLWRQLGTPDREFERFLQHVQALRLKPICFENADDKFVTRNFTKYNLANPPFSTGTDKHSRHIVVREKIINFNDADGERLKNLTTLWGESLVDFQHFFLLSIFPSMRGRVIDFSKWLVQTGNSNILHYEAVFSLAIAHFVHFEDFDVLDSENEFTSNVVVPAFERVHKRFGLKPIIAKISRPGEFDQDPYWWCYSKEAKSILDARRNAAHRQIADADDAPLLSL